MSRDSVCEATRNLEVVRRTWTTGGTALNLTARDGGFLVLVFLSIAWSWQPLLTVVGRSLNRAEYEHYSHIILLPFLSGYLLYINRQAILERVRAAPRPGSIMVAAGALGSWLAGSQAVSDPDHRLSIAIVAVLTTWLGAFVICYGIRALQAAAFPFFLLVFVVPIPPAILEWIIVFLQKASANASEVVFGLIGMPTLRDGLFFSLPGLKIHVARQCSGIRSSLALVISGLVLAHLVLRSAWARAGLVLVIVPLAIAKNAIRIVLLSWLAVHVDRSFIEGSVLHESGGIPFFLASLTVLGGLAWLFRQGELWKGKRSHSVS